MNQSVARCTISIVVLAAIAVSQMVAWPSTWVCTALSADGRFCRGQGPECCGGHEPDAGEVEREADQANENHPLAKDCGCSQCFCKVFPAPAFLTASNGYALLLPDFLFPCEAGLSIHAYNFSRNPFHPPRA